VLLAAVKKRANINDMKVLTYTLSCFTMYAYFREQQFTHGRKNSDEDGRVSVMMQFLESVDSNMG